MSRIEHDGIQSSTCASCNGEWISGNSLHELFAREEDAPHIEEALDTILALDFRDGHRHCPTCRGRRLKTLYVESIELDYCIGCKGLFFDPGELERVFPNTYRSMRESGEETPPDTRNLLDVIMAIFSGRKR